MSNFSAQRPVFTGHSAPRSVCFSAAGRSGIPRLFFGALDCASTGQTSFVSKSLHQASSLDHRRTSSSDRAAVSVGGSRSTDYIHCKSLSCSYNTLLVEGRTPQSWRRCERSLPNLTLRHRYAHAECLLSWSPTMLIELR